MIDTDVTVVLVSIATVATIMMIGLAFLPFPGRASAIWSIGFAVAMAATYLWLTAETIGSPHLRAASTGPLLAATGLIWVGLRARRGADRVYVVPTVLVFAVVTAALAATATTPAFGLVFRLAFVVAGLFTALSADQLLRISGGLRDVAFPLAIASIAVSVFSVLVIVDSLARLSNSTLLHTVADMQSAGSLNAIAASVYIVCALVTLIGLTRTGHAPGSVAGPLDFDEVAQGRLDRAARAGDARWAVLDIRLDDPEDLLAASSEQAFARIVTRFTADVEAVLPPECDIVRVSGTRIVALLPRPDAVARTVVSQILDRVSTPGESPAIPVRLSASVGVAAVAVTGYDVTALRAAAAAAADEAQQAGGDRVAHAAPVGSGG